VGYWDSSALAKLYAKEPDSPTFEQFAMSAQTVPITSRLALYEIQTTLRRKEAEGTLTSGAAEANYQRLTQDAAAGHIRVIEFSPDVEREFQTVLTRCFQHVPPFLVRTLDAIHLSSALVAVETEFVATDRRLRDAALFLGLKVFPN
jgi:predicted nucleic acid-binding protein